MNFYYIFLNLCNSINKSPSKVVEQIGSTRAAVNRWKNGSMPSDTTLLKLANYFGVSVEYLKGETENKKTPTPNITSDYTAFPVIGEVAAGYDSIGIEDWEGETVDIPNSYLKGRDKREFFVLKVKGDSMYPMYIEGDKVLVLKQSTLNYSGQVGVVLYDDEYTSLKKIEYKTGENWFRMVPINPTHPIRKIENEELEHCKILGIPKMLIREIEE